MADPKTLISNTATDGHGPAAPKETLSLVLMDSGMGGLSICADIVVGLQRRRNFKRVDITYFNAWPEQNRGYNSFADQIEQLRIFDAALAGAQVFAPDILFIACNTLSVLYPQTAFSRSAHIPVVGVVDFGVDLMLDHLAARPSSQVIILGTLTTIAAGIHRDTLIAKGIDGRRIVSQACDQLATAIENGPDSPKVHAMIDDFVVQAVSRLHFPEYPVSAALCCTHYDYSKAYFKNSLETYIGSNTVVLSPNESMGGYFFKLFEKGSFSEISIDLKVVSRIRWSDRKIAAISDILQPVSPVTARALRDYRYDPELFSF